MFAIEKTIGNHKIELLNDYNGNGRLFIDDEVICDVNWGRQNSLKKFREAGWEYASSDSFIVNKSGNFKGQPKLVDYIGAPKYYFDLESSIMEDNKLVAVPVKWFETAIELIIDQNWEALSKKKIVSNKKEVQKLF